MELYRDQWRPRSEALAMEFEDRFAALTWKDAEGFYKLGRWADTNAEFLPQAKDRAYRAYQAGYKANPDHAGIRRELGLDVSSTETLIEDGQVRLEYRDAITGIAARSPVGWRRGESRDGVRWEDPASETAYITERFLGLSGAKADDLWQTITAPLRKLPGFTAIAEESPARSGGQQRLLRYSFAEDRLVRYATMVFFTDDATQLGVIVEASYIDEEKDKELKALDEVVERLAFPAPKPSEDKDSKDAKDKGGKPDKGSKPDKGDAKAVPAGDKKADDKKPAPPTK
jgi:hypothetical protein